MLYSHHLRIAPLALGMSLLAVGLLPAAEPAPDLAVQAQAILRKHCFDCHGKNPRKIRGDGKGLKILDHAALIDKEHQRIVPGKPDESKVIQYIENADDPMPPAPRPAVPESERKVLRDWIAAGAPPPPEGAGAAPEPDLAARVKELFRSRCLECHGGSKVQGGVRILDHNLLLAKQKIVPGKPEASQLWQLLTAQDDSVMPPAGQPRLSPDAIDLVRRWLAAGAPPFPADAAVPAEKDKEVAFKDVVGIDYVLKKILAHVRNVPVDDRRYVRYFSINHLLTGGATRAELDLQRDALAKAINHLSWEPTLVRPTPIDEPVNSVFAVDIRKLGWQRQPFQCLRDGRLAGKSEVNLFDLVLLEYPYAALYEDSETFDRLTEEFLQPTGQVRPIPYVRADWFSSVVTQTPLYEDLLQLPHQLRELEALLGVDVDANLADHVARRAGMTVSGVSRNNRIVERHPARNGAYWKSLDFRTSKGPENMFKDPVRLKPTGGEVIFNLPNGLQGYLLANGNGDRLDAAPTEIVTDKFAEDKTVRNGLACMRCHDQGMKSFEDTVRPAIQRLPGSTTIDKRETLQLYAEKAEMDRLLKEDAGRFLGALERALGKPQDREPLIPVSQRFLDAPLQLPAASAELGLSSPDGLQHLFRSPQFASLGLVPLAVNGVVRRDMWEDYYDQVVRHLGLGVPVVPLDGLTRTDYQLPPPRFQVELKTSKKNNVFEPGDVLVIFVNNPSDRDLFIELIGTSARGQKVVLAPAGTCVKARQQFRHPSGDQVIRIQGGLGKEQITLFACDTPFPAGELLRGKGVADRFVHPFYQWRRDGKRLELPFDPSRMVKKTLEIETR
jgi:mono/diheme cytochrome c family protein